MLSNAPTDADVGRSRDRDDERGIRGALRSAARSYRPSFAYTTVQTMLNVLHRKGKVRRVLKGRAYFHRPALSRRQVLARTMRELIDRWFGGSATELVMTLIEDRQVSEEKLTELRNRVNRAEANADGKH